VPRSPFITRSEELFARYLDAHGYAYAYDQLTPAGKRPDFLVRTTSGQVMVEVSEINATATWRNEGRYEFAEAPNYAAKIGRKMADKSQQVAGLSIPAVLLLAFPRWRPDVHDFMQALFGQLVMRVSLNAAFEPHLSTNGSGAEAQPRKNTRWSALAELVLYNPTLKLETVGGAETLEDGCRRSVTAFTDPGFVSDAREPRLRVYDNPYAAHPLSRGVFEGPRDERFAHDGHKTFGPCWVGPDVPPGTPASWR